MLDKQVAGLTIEDKKLFVTAAYMNWVFEDFTEKGFSAFLQDMIQGNGFSPLNTNELIESEFEDIYLEDIFCGRDLDRTVGDLLNIEDDLLYFVQRLLAAEQISTNT